LSVGFSSRVYDNAHSREVFRHGTKDMVCHM
jgi:hypothetical protein